jgi:hypothetical protein
MGQMHTMRLRLTLAMLVALVVVLIVSGGARPVL